MEKIITIKFVDGKILSIPDLIKYDGKWFFENKKEKIVCRYKGETSNIKYQIFSNGFFKLSKKDFNGKWITLKKGFLKKGNLKKFSGYIIIPTEFVISRIKCVLV